MKRHIKDRDERLVAVSEMGESRRRERKSRDNKRLPLNVLVVDDDPMFRKVANRMGHLKQIAVTTCGSFEELQAVGLPDIYDAAVVDYCLDGIWQDYRGLDVALQLGRTPVILISGNKECVTRSEAWPTSIVKFIEKSEGIERILESAMAIKLAELRSESEPIHRLAGKRPAKY